MNRLALIIIALGVCFAFFVPRTAQAQVLFPLPSLTGGVGYSNVQTQKAGGLFYDHNGTYLDVDAAWGLPVVPLNVGVSVSGSDYYDRESTSLPSNNNYYPYDHARSDFSMLEIEPRIGLYLGGHRGFFVEPRIGAGLLVDWYGIDQANTSNGNSYLSTQFHTGAAFEVRPAIRVGYSWGFIAAGAEASYMYAVGDFGGLGHSAREARIGAFITFNL